MAEPEGIFAGLRFSRKLMQNGEFDNPSVSFADSSLCTREPWELPLQCIVRSTGAVGF